MNVGSVVAQKANQPGASLRTLVFDLEQRPTPVEHTIACDCGFAVRSGRSPEEHAAHLRGVGWTAVDSRLRCSECSAGVVRRVVIGSKGDRYVLRRIGDAWRCVCRGYAYRGRCNHAESLEKESERTRLAALARDFLKECEAGATIYPATFLEWLGAEAREVTVERCRIVLGSVLDGYRHVCRECGGSGAESEHATGWDEPVVEGVRCSHCDGDGELAPPRLVSRQHAITIAAE